MADRVAISVQTSQDQQNNSVKHPEIGQELYNSINCCLLLVKPDSSFEKLYSRMQHLETRLYTWKSSAQYFIITVLNDGLSWEQLRGHSPCLEGLNGGSTVTVIYRTEIESIQLQLKSTNYRIRVY